MKAQTIQLKAGFFTGYKVARIGEAPRVYDLIEGAGIWGGEWAAVEVRGQNRETAIFSTRREAEEHIHLSQKGL